MKYRLIPYYNINIPIREEHIQSLIRRFDPECEYEDCILCLTYYHPNRVNPCEHCPIGKFGLFACYLLAPTILGTDTKVDIELIANKKHKETKQDALKLKKWFESLPTKEVGNEV